MARKSDRQNQQPSIESAKKRPAKTGPNGKKIDLTSLEVDEAKGAVPDSPVVEMPDVLGALEPSSELPSDYQFDIDVLSKEYLSRVTVFMTAKHCHGQICFFECARTFSATTIW